jgi:hypothetical protein
MASFKRLLEASQEWERWKVLPILVRSSGRRHGYPGTGPTHRLMEQIAKDRWVERMAGGYGEMLAMADRNNKLGIATSSDTAMKIAFGKVLVK